MQPPTEARAGSTEPIKALCLETYGKRSEALHGYLRASHGTHAVSQTQVCGRFLNPRPVELRSQC